MYDRAPKMGWWGKVTTTLIGLLLYKKACYHGDNIGCFDNKPPYNNALRKVPQSPDRNGVEFLLYTRSNPTAPQKITKSPISLTNSYYDRKENTKFIIHGFRDHAAVSWIKKMTVAILKKENANVIIVGWEDGSNKVTYSQAAANTRVVGAMTAELMKSLHSNAQASYAMMHLIGHSLGAHAAGYAGERVSGTGRITGLDPAGHYFANKNSKVRLDPSDALFVDVIHTDGEPITDLGFGLQQAIGDVDFYPNGGKDQPGCDFKITKNFLYFINGNFEALTDSIGCSHLRVFKLFTESINSACQFEAYPCSSYSDFKADKCSSCGTSCTTMGYTTDTSKRGSFYLTTASSSPFCQG